MHRRHLVGFMVILIIFTLQACGSNSSNSGTGSGTAAVSFTDGPGDYDHVWITVKDIGFHTSDASGPDEPGWLKFPLSTPVTVDLIAVGNGNSPQSIWGNITLPVGNYQQIRLFLAPTFTANPPSGHTYFNEVVIGSNTYPLRIPDAEHGIKLVGTFQVTDGGSLNLAIDFDAGSDVVDFRSGKEYILKPRLAYFDLDDVGAIVGQIDTTSAATNPTARFVFKTEQISGDGTHHVVRRYSTLSDSTTGKYVIYPIPSGTYDLLLRGIGYETVIIKNVPVTKGTTPTSNPTGVPLIAMVAGTDYPVTASITHPTGAWVNFYQTLPGGGELPYEVRFRHFNPLTGQFSNYELSNSQIQSGTYDSSSILLTGMTPVEGIGGYQAVADAIRYDSSSPQTVTSGAATVTFSTPLAVTSPWTSNSITGNISIPASGMNKMDQGVLFTVHGGIIVDTLTVDKGEINMLVGGSYTLSNIPGGRPAALYGVDAAGWSSTVPATRAIALPARVDLRTGNATGVNMNMIMLP
ncbi:MAG: DUF4382 domain-containing protein [Nitrospirae bacterium]|nr:DUF4382 domain-containing protein [Nitrospirota bacterium]